VSEDIKPTIDLPFEEAMQELTGFEILGVQKHFGMDMEKLGGVKTLMGTVWAYENRDGQKTSWINVENLTLRELNGYFAQAEPEPEGGQGKESNLAEERLSD
jgi:hypothetical protein